MKMPNDDFEWKPTHLSDVFDVVERGRRIVSAKHIEGDRPLVSSMGSNNGVTGFVGNEKGVRIFSDCLTVANGGASAGKCYYHPYEFVASDHVTHAECDAMDEDSSQSLAVCLTKALTGKFSFSHEIKDEHLPRERVMMPVDDRDNPDWLAMASITRGLRGKMLGRYREYLIERLGELQYQAVPSLDDVEWGRFKVFADGYLSIATTSSSIDGIRLIDGDDDAVPYVTRSDKNNGIARFVSTSNFQYGSDAGGCITVGLDTQTAFWQPQEFVTGQNVQVITGETLNEYVALFLIPLLITQMRAKFNWGGNGATLGRMKKLEMVLPITDDGKPDWAYMEQYAKNMMLRKYEQYLGYLKRMSQS